MYIWSKLKIINLYFTINTSAGSHSSQGNGYLLPNSNKTKFRVRKKIFYDHMPRWSCSFILLQEYTTSINFHWALCLGKGTLFGRTPVISLCKLLNWGFFIDYYSVVKILLVIWMLYVTIQSPVHIQGHISTL